MYAGVGDILRGYGRRRKTDGVNNRGVAVRREIIWLPETYTDPNTRMENFGEAIFSKVLTTRRVSDLRPFCGAKRSFPKQLEPLAMPVNIGWNVNSLIDDRDRSVFTNGEETRSSRRSR